MDVSENNGTPKSSILIGFSIINHPFWDTPIFGNTHMYLVILLVTFLGWLSDPLTGESWPPTKGIRRSLWITWYVYIYIHIFICPLVYDYMPGSAPKQEETPLPPTNLGYSPKTNWHVSFDMIPTWNLKQPLEKMDGNGDFCPFSICKGLVHHPIDSQAIKSACF